MTMNDKIWWIEHQIRGLTQGRRMRPGKAIRRLFSTSDEKTCALARLWNGADFGVEVSAEEPAWVGAYSEIRSCMQGYGALCFRAYSRHGVSIITARRDGKYVARALTVGGATPKLTAKSLSPLKLCSKSSVSRKPLRGSRERSSRMNSLLSAARGGGFSTSRTAGKSSCRAASIPPRTLRKTPPNFPR